MNCVMNWALPLLACSVGQAGGAPTAEPPGENLSIKISVELRVPRTIIPVGGEVIVEFAIINRTPDPVTLSVPNATQAKIRLPEMALPLEHIYSGVNFRGLEVATDANPRLGDRVVRKPDYPIPSLTIAPFGVVGLRFDVARFYPVLHQAGTYVLQWSPYGGAVKSKPVTIRVVSFKQVVMETDYGPLTMRLLYDKAPRHVENFIDLVNDRFYNGKTMHVVVAGQFIQGGCPNGDGKGKRPDGVCLEPEFSNTPIDVGTVAMALVEYEYPERDDNSASCQFFISLARQPAWDGRYTAFAQIEGPESLAALRKMSQVSVDENNRPTEPLRIKSMSVVDLPFPPRFLGR